MYIYSKMIVYDILTILLQN